MAVQFGWYCSGCGFKFTEEIIRGSSLNLMKLLTIPSPMVKCLSMFYSCVNGLANLSYAVGFSPRTTENHGLLIRKLNFADLSFELRF